MIPNVKLPQIEINVVGAPSQDFSYKQNKTKHMYLIVILAYRTFDLVLYHLDLAIVMFKQTPLWLTTEQI